MSSHTIPTHTYRHIATQVSGVTAARAISSLTADAPSHGGMVAPLRK